MPIFRQESIKNLLLILILLSVATAFGAIGVKLPASSMVLIAGGCVLFTIAFIRSDIALYILIFSMLLSPEFIVGDIAGKGTLGRGVTLRMDDLVLLILGAGWFARSALKKDSGLFLHTPLNRPIFYYLVVCAIATGFGVMVEDVNAKTGFFYVFKYFEYFIVYFMVVNHVRDRRMAVRLMWCLLLTAAIISFYGMLQIPGGGRVTAPFEGLRGEPNTLGGYLLFVGALVIGILSRTNDNTNKIVYGFLLAAIAISFLYTESRSSYMALVPTALTLALCMKKKGFAVAFLILVMAASPLFLPQRAKQRILHTFTQQPYSHQIIVAGVRLDTSTSARLLSWKNAVSDWTCKPVLGYGVSGYGFIDAQFPKVLVETGILGLGAFTYLLFSIFKVAVRNLRRSTDPYFRGLAIGYLAGYVGIVVHSLGANTFIIVRIMEPFWFVTAIIVAMGRIDKQELAENPEPTVFEPGIQKRRISWRDQTKGL